MVRKKNMKGLDQESMEFIDSYNVDRTIGNTNSYVNCSKALDYKVNLKCKNEKQKQYHKLIKEKEVTCCAGSAGTGKSYIALATALELLKGDNSFKKIMIVVPTIQSDIEVGFLKGSLEEKIMPHAQAHLYTLEKILNNSGNVGKLALKTLIDCGLIEFKCVSFMRGMTIDNTIVIIEEAQNLPKSALKTLLSRIGDNSKYIISGDYEQVDNKPLKQNVNLCGLKYVIDTYTEMDEIGTIEFTKNEIVRNPLITKILDKWED